MSKKERQCVSCEKKINIKISQRKKTYGVESDEGVFFHPNAEHLSGHGGKWFCNECWEKIKIYQKKR